MGLFDDYKNARKAVRKQTTQQITDALRTAGVRFDMSRQNVDYFRTRDSRHAYVKAVELVSELLGQFTLPERPKLSCLGLMKNATNKDGHIDDGIIKVGASLRTLLGHKANIELPVIIRDSKLMEPAVFFYDGSPYVICQAALDDLVKTGQLEKSVLYRRMFQPPYVNQAQDTAPNRPIINQQHMFSPGPRSPWRFQRHSQKDQLAITFPGWDVIQEDGEGFTVAKNFRADTNSPFYTEALPTADQGMQPLPEVRIYINNDGVMPEFSVFGMIAAPDGASATDPMFMFKEPSKSRADAIKAIQRLISQIEKYFGVKLDVSQYDTSQRHIRNYPPGAADDYGAAVHSDQQVDCYYCRTGLPCSKKTCPKCQQAHCSPGAKTCSKCSSQRGAQKTQRQRTNIDTPTVMPELWVGDVPDEMLDPAERSREGLFTPGDTVKLDQDFEARERGGGVLIIPKGEEGYVMRDTEGDWKMPYVCFPTLKITTSVPKRMLKAAAATVTHVQNEIRDMVREGYPEVDIKEAISRRYPALAAEALKSI